MKVLKLPTVFVDGEEDVDYDTLGIKPPTIDDYMYVNINNIDYFNEDTKGEVKLVMSGESYKITMEFNKFLKLIEEV